MNSSKGFAKWVLAGALAVGAIGAIHTAPADAGAVRQGETYSTVRAEGIDVYRVAFLADSPAIVIIRGDGSTVLHAYVYDENGNLITSDTDGDGTGAILLRWNPSWTGSFKIRIVNTGDVSNAYHLETN